MNRSRQISSYILIVLLFASCGKEPMPIIPSSVPIKLDVSGEGMKGSTRANVFGDENAALEDFVNDPANNPNDFYDAGKGGGNFWLQAFVHGKTDANQGALRYIDSRVWWNRDIAAREIEEGASGNPHMAWQFLEGDEQTGTTYEVYWPKNEELDFFAFMPWNLSDYLSDAYDITVGYNESEGVQLSCRLPETYFANDATQEFVYSFASNREMQDGTVPLRFVHPFAIVRFKLQMGSYRLNIREIKFNGIKLTGSFSNGDNTFSQGGLQPYTVPFSCWTPTGNSLTQTYEIDKKIPAEINYNAVFGGPYIVMPQDIEDITMDIIAERIDADKGADYNKYGVSIKTESVSRWEPGKMYTYSLKLGDGYSEVVFDVDVEPWVIEGETIKEIE